MKCANVGFGASIVAMNAYLPTLARHSEEVVKHRVELHNALSAAGLPHLSGGDSSSLDVSESGNEVVVVRKKEITAKNETLKG